MEVHDILGCGFLEAVYLDALENKASSINVMFCRFFTRVIDKICLHFYSLKFKECKRCNYLNLVKS